MSKWTSEQMNLLSRAVDRPPASTPELENFAKRMAGSDQPEQMTDDEIKGLALNGYGVKEPWVL